MKCNLLRALNRPKVTRTRGTQRKATRHDLPMPISRRGVSWCFRFCGSRCSVAKAGGQSAWSLPENHTGAVCSVATPFGTSVLQMQMGARKQSRGSGSHGLRPSVVHGPNEPQRGATLQFARISGGANVGTHYKNCSKPNLKYGRLTLAYVATVPASLYRTAGRFCEATATSPRVAGTLGVATVLAICAHRRVTRGPCSPWNLTKPRAVVEPVRPRGVVGTRKGIHGIVRIPMRCAPRFRVAPAMRPAWKIRILFIDRRVRQICRECPERGEGGRGTDR